MSGWEDIEELALELAEKTDGSTRYFQWAVIFIESDWLAVHDARVRAEGEPA